MTQDDDNWGKLLPGRKGQRADWRVSHNKKEGFTLILVTVSRFRMFVDSVADRLCVLTGHRFCNSLFLKVDDWAASKDEVLAEIPIDRETADRLAWRYGFWDYLDDNEDETAK